MRKAKAASLSVALCMLSLTSLAVASGPAHAATETTTCATRWQQDPMTIGAVGKTVHVPGLQVVQCTTHYGFIDPAAAASLITLRIQPGVCDPATTFDSACFSIYVDRAPIAGFSNVTVQVSVDGEPLQPVDVDIPQHPLADGGSTCVFSIGYHAAPTHACVAYWDLGQ
jgi:hypothetical protein